ncbi:MAG TPA: hypothetical protein VNH11_10565 [Pirellulales bacterium]|nr:hypothetical protein [Pirellulales bacterium]
MKFFTPDLYVRLQRPDVADMDAADADWEDAEGRYERRLAAVRDKLPDSALKLLDGVRLHDAEVFWMGQTGPFFAILLKRDSPLSGTVLMTYRTVDKVRLNSNAFASEFRATLMQWMYDEVDLGSRPDCFRHSVLFSNGSQLEVEADEVQIATVDTLYASNPKPCTPSTPTSKT